jgi:hypothetical protein
VLRARRSGRQARSGGERKLGLEIAIVFKLGLWLGHPQRTWPGDRAFRVGGDLLAAGAVERLLDRLLR